VPENQRPPAPDRLIGWRPDDAVGIVEATDLLSHGEVSVEGRLPWSSNQTFLVTVGEGDRQVRAVYKPFRGERPLWDFPDGLYRREVAAYLLSEALGWGLVPVTVERENGPFGVGSFQLFVDANFEQHYFPLFEGGAHHSALQAVCAFDLAANNTDRKSGHVLLGTCGDIWAIDHGVCFNAEPKLRTVIWDFADEPIPAELLADLDRVAGDLPDDLVYTLGHEEVEALVDRLGYVVASGIFPEPDPNRHAYPWPLV
jgi:uncharacterized repeat protein (TIGR03843 family)